MGFERPNLHFSVQRKQPALAANFGPLLAAAGERRGRWAGVGGQLESVLSGEALIAPTYPLFPCHCREGGAGAHHCVHADQAGGG